MKITPQRIAETVAHIEVCLGIINNKRVNQPNIDRAIEALEKLRGEIELKEETPIDWIGLSYETSDYCEKSGVRTIEQLMAMGKEQILSIRGIGEDRYLEIYVALEAYLEMGEL